MDRFASFFLGWVCLFTTLHANAVDVPGNSQGRRFLAISACAREIEGAAQFGDETEAEPLPAATPAMDMWGGDARGSKTDTTPRTLQPIASAEQEFDRDIQPELAMLESPPEPFPVQAPQTTPVPEEPQTDTATFSPTLTNDSVPMEFPEQVIERAQLGLHNEWQLLFGANRHNRLHEFDFDITVLLRSPNLQILTYGAGVAVPESIRESRRTLLDHGPHEVYSLNAQIQIGLQELGTDYRPSSDQELIQAFVMMDSERSWTGPTRQLLKNLTSIHELSSESYVRDQDNELDLGRAQDNLANWMRRLLFRLLAGNTDPEKLAPLEVYNSRFPTEYRSSLQGLVRSGAVDGDLLTLYHTHDYALLSAVRELHARMTLPSKSALSVPSRIAIKVLVEALQEVEGDVLRAAAENDSEYPIVWDLDPRASSVLGIEPDERHFEVESESGKRTVDGIAFRTRLKLTLRSLLARLCQNDRMRPHIHRYSQNLGLAVRWLRRAEAALIVEKERYTAHSTAAEIAQHAVAMVALPRRAGGLLLPDSIAVDGWIKKLPPDLREIGLLVIDYHGGYEDPFTNEWVSLNGRTAREVLFRIGSREEREQIIAAQFFTRGRMHAARKAAGVHYLRALRDSIRTQVEEKRGVRVWQAVATRAEAMEKVAVARAVSTVTDYLGHGTPLGDLVEAADLEKKKQGIDPATPLTEKISLEECHLPSAPVLAASLLDTWNQTVLGERPKAAARGYVGTIDPNSFIAGLNLPEIPKTALDRPNTLLTSILERLDEISWKTYEGNIAARRARNLSRSNASNQADFDAAEKDFRQTIAKQYDAPMQQVQTYFTKFHRSIRMAFIEEMIRRKQGGDSAAAPVDAPTESPDDGVDATSVQEEALLAQLSAQEIARAKQEADVTLLHMITPYEALIWCILQGETNTNQRFLNDLARHILRQCQNWNGQTALDDARPRPRITRRELMWRSGLSLSAAVLSSAVTWGVNHWLTTPDDADRSPPAAVEQPADATVGSRAIDAPTPDSDSEE